MQFWGPLLNRDLPVFQNRQYQLFCWNTFANTTVISDVGTLFWWPLFQCTLNKELNSYTLKTLRRLTICQTRLIGEPKNFQHPSKLFTWEPPYWYNTTRFKRIVILLSEPAIFSMFLLTFYYFVAVNITLLLLLLLCYYYSLLLRYPSSLVRCL